MGESSINDRDKVPVDNLANILVQDGSHPAACDDNYDDNALASICLFWGSFGTFHVLATLEIWGLSELSS